MMIKSPNRRGVTILEFLACFAVIAMIFSILLPAASYSREQGVRVHCQNNLRQIATFASMYAYDDAATILGPVHHDVVLHPEGGGSAYGGGPGSATYMGWGQDFSPETRPLNPLIFGKGGKVGTGGPGDSPQFKLFECRSDAGWQTFPDEGGGIAPETRSYVLDGTSYRMNDLALDDQGTVGILGRSKVRIPEPALTVAFMESRAFQTIFTNPVWGPTPRPELMGWHRLAGWFNVAYADGRVDYVDFGDGTYYPHGSAGLDARGTWGRMDCLPDPPILFP
jgi:hypothetical protein